MLQRTHCISGTCSCVNLQSPHGASAPEHSLQKYMPAQAP